ncbi:NrsF family protein [Lysobacter sp. D1-1-M9]|uniref:NrsF family protein n=1 Tax=Novilysobacter longmucuonensis TaxID=3098603 RepID=UPI002FCB7717
MNDADRLIQQLAARAAPVRRLAPPLRRTLLWLALAVTIIAVVIASHGPRPDLTQALAGGASATQWLASLLTGALAAYAVFQISVPGRSPSWTWLPLPASMLWLLGLGWGCMRDFARFGGDAFAFDAASAECAWTITLVSLPLGLTLLLMVRHAGAVRPAPTALLAALSAAALSAAAVSLIHEGETALMVLLWHAGAVVLLSLLSWAFGRQLFGWIGYARREG